MRLLNAYNAIYSYTYITRLYIIQHFVSFSKSILIPTYQLLLISGKKTVVVTKQFLQQFQITIEAILTNLNRRKKNLKRQACQSNSK